MKSTFYRKVCAETAIEVTGEADNIIDNLRQLNSRCLSSDADGVQLYFECLKDGRLRIGSLSDSKNCVYGKVESDGKKTVVRLYEVCDYSRVIIRWVIFVLCILLVICGFEFGDFFFLIALLLLGFDFADLIRTGLSEKRNSSIDFSIMKKEIINRIKAAEKWDK